MQIRGAHWVLVGKPDGKRPLARPRHRWKNNVKNDLKEICLEGVHGTDLAANRGKWMALVNTVMYMRVP
jgi:hypothetical protein